MADVLVIGAGPYGVAIAGELAARGREPLLVGEPFDTWHRHTPDRMLLRSDPKASEIHAPDGRYSLLSHLRRNGGPERGAVPVAAFRDYLREVEADLPCELVRDRVTSLSPAGDRFAARLAGGRRLTARAVVLATGPGAHAWLPEAIAALPRERVLHSWQSERIAALRGRRVLVVGGGQSAAEAVDALRAHNRVSWAVRRPPLFFQEPLRVPTPLFKTFLAAYRAICRLPPPVLRGVGRVVFRTTVSPSMRPAWDDPEVEKLLGDAEGLRLRVEGTGVCGGAARETWDLVVAATGYHCRIGGLDFLAPELTAALGGSEAVPRPRADFSSAVPGLYLVGCLAEPAFGPVMRFILGSRLAARRISGALAPPRSGTG